ncbi:hypothetical protein D9611_009212 [Ephemerocybe angulata]|uniref:Uncharacterized protein n=1 Tax=Ephemerocybe angulata TaxID=980116 RepID=A0A8H5BH88_9AGAR|nr:hypothetical protein D9611_009212 [Tulosesus angulatus]
MEARRRQLAEDPRFFTLQQDNRLAQRHRDVISVGSTSSESSQIASAPRRPMPNQMRNPPPIEISSDDDEPQVVPNTIKTALNAPGTRPLQPTNGARAPFIQPGFLKLGPPKPSQVPTPAASSSSSSSSKDKDAEEIPVPNFQDDYRVYTSAETEKELRDLMGNAMNQDVEVDVDMEDAIVPGFKDGITLLAHQIVGRAWMKERETGKKAGGILADDMGLGKTIQTLTRIVEGKPHQSDREDGWSGCTLVVCPLSVVDQWKSEVEKMTKLRVVKHQGPNRTTDPAALRNNHIVVTTYDTVKSEYDNYTPSAKDESKQATLKKKKSRDYSSDSDSESDNFAAKLKAKSRKAPAKKCALFGIRWWRIVLDEAHTIKNAKTKAATSCCELEAKYRWCLTGTPMQNNVSEVQSLFKFLRIKPYSDANRFNVDIGKPISSGRGAGRAMKRLQVVLKNIMLRRRKNDTLNGKVLIELPKRTVEVVPCPFDAHEKNFYESLETKMETVLDKLMKDANGKGGGAYMSVLLLLLRLRQACNHPLLVSKDFKKDSDAIESTPAKEGGEDPDDLVAAFGQLAVIRKCQMCTTVLDSTNTGQGDWKTHCTSCVPLAKEARLAELERPTSAKIRKMISILREIEEREGNEKTIIFSQFTSMLDLIEPFLEDERVRYVRFDGSMKTAEREVSLNAIKTDPKVKVILISFKAGSTGLNLTACNNVILVDMWWNPALEDQAFDRAHRYGQTKDVWIYKLKVDGTVEDRILELQEKKRELANAALSGDKIKNMRLGMDDLLALFRPGRGDDDDDDDD